MDLDESSKSCKYVVAVEDDDGLGEVSSPDEVISNGG
jgi:hypothetical protein